MPTIHIKKATILLLPLLTMLPFQQTVSQDTLTIRNAAANLSLIQQMSTPQNVKFLNDNYRLVLQKGSDSLKVAYGYLLGNLYQKAAIDNKFSDTSQLRHSEKYYHNVLSIDRKQVPARQNLVLVLQAEKKYEQALKNIDTLLSINFMSRNRYLFSQGEILLEAKQDPVRAIHSFTEVLRTEPDNFAALGRILSIYTPGPDMPDKEILFNTATNLKYISSPEPSMKLLERYIAILPAADQINSQKALTAWADLLSDKKFISVRVFTQPPSSDQALLEKWKELEAIVKKPSYYSEGWWSLGNRRYIPGRIRLNLANMAFNQGNAARADSIYRIIYRTIPRLGEINMHTDNQMFSLRMDLAYNMTALFIEYPRLQNYNINIRKIEQELFQTKSDFYQGNDLTGQFRMHYLLGSMYAGQGIWVSDISSQNALFQLEHAADVFNKIIVSDPGFYRPLPDVYFQLASGMEIKNDRPKAGRYYIEACRAFLDIDNLQSAQECLEKAGEFLNNLPVSDDLKSLKKLLEIRIDLANQSTDNIDPALSQINYPDLISQKKGSPDFMSRQLFKINADLGLLKANRGLSPEMEYSRALALISGRQVLSNSQDFERIQWISLSLAEKVIVRGLGPEYRIFVPDLSTGVQSSNYIWTINLPGTDRRLAIEIAHDLLLTAQKNVMTGIQEKPSEETKPPLKQESKSNMMKKKLIQSETSKDQGNLPMKKQKFKSQQP